MLGVWTDKKGNVVEKLVEDAIALGLDDFWGAASWIFKEKHTTVTTTASQETVDLPYDFDGLISVVERVSNGGTKLEKFNPDEYDRLMPDSGSYAENTPDMYKVYFDQGDEVWKLALYPTPSAAISLRISYHTISDNGNVPGKFIGGLMESIGRHLLMPGTVDRRNARYAFYDEIKRLEKINTADNETLSKFSDSGDVAREYDWVEHLRVRNG